METLKWTEKLAKYAIYVAAAAIICAILWYFRSIVVYLLVAGVLSLIGNPLASGIRKLNIKGHHLPDWAVATVTLLVIVAIFVGIIYAIVPITTSVGREIGSIDINNVVKSLAVPLHNLNTFLIDTLPNLEPDFKIELVVLEHLQQFLNVSMFSSVISSVTSFIAGVCVALFAIIFISFFFFKDENLFSGIIAAFVPDKSEEDAKIALGDISHLLTRYFLGLLVEIIGVAVLNFLGLALIAKMGVNAAISIAVLTGIMNVIPYIGPIFGGVIGTVLALVIKYSSTGVGLDVNFWVFVLILVAIFCVTQLVDNYLYKPVIYSNSIKAHPLEIFVVTVMAGTIGGILGMFVAIPCYTVFRVIAGRFFRNVKFIRRLIPDTDN